MRIALMVHVRLVGGNTNNEGICYNNVWGSICDDNWGIADSNVVCYQLRFYPHGTRIFCTYL